MANIPSRTDSESSGLGLSVAVLVPPTLARGAGLLFSLGAGLIFLLAQQDTFAGGALWWQPWAGGATLQALTLPSPFSP
jgi:hypothetical protein